MMKCFYLPTDYPVKQSNLNFPSKNTNPPKLLSNFINRPAMYYQLSENKIEIHNLKEIEFILKNTNTLFSPDPEDKKFSTVMDGILSSTGTKWKESRKIFKKSFSQSQLQLYISNFIKISEELTATWKTSYPDSFMVELTSAFLPVSLQGVNSCLFGLETKQDHQFICRFLKKMMTSSSISDFSWKKNIKHPYSFIISSLMLWRYRKVLKNIAKMAPRDSENIVSLLERTRTERTVPFSLTGEISTMIGAGSATTSVTLSWAIYLLAKHQKIQKDLSQSKVNLNSLVPLNQINENPSLVDRVILETLRLYPGLIGIARTSNTENVFGGHPYPKNTTFIIRPITIHRNPLHWENPNSFDPSRPEWESRDFGLKYIPFGYGPKTCIGSQFSLQFMRCMLTYLVRNFHFELKEEPSDELDSWLLLLPKGGINVKVTKR